MSDPFQTLFGVDKPDVETEEDRVKRYLLEGTGITPNKKYKLDMFAALRAMDRKDRGFYDRLNEEEKKGFSPYTMVRWASCVTSNDPILVEWWIKATNICFNTNMLELMSGENKKPKLAWLLATTASPGIGEMKRQWIGHKKKEGKTNNKVKKFLIGQYPTLSDSEIELLMTTLTNKEIKQYAIDLGYNDKDTKAIFK